MVRRRTNQAFATTSLPIRIVTFNVRYATESPAVGEEPWAVRCPKLCAQLDFITAGHYAAFICLQEVLHSQLRDIEFNLGPSWTYIGQGRDDGETAGEFSPVFFRTDTWQCDAHRTYWLSDTPEKPSKGWDAVLNRVVTVGSFSHVGLGLNVLVMSTHFDHVGVKARKESAKLILRIADEWIERSGGAPLLLGGDFNSTPEDSGYITITEPEVGMTDLLNLVPKERRYGNENTFTSFGEPGADEKRIDFLFVRDTAEIKIRTFGILSNRFDDGIFISDHRPVVADMEVPANRSKSVDAGISETSS